MWGWHGARARHPLSATRALRPQHAQDSLTPAKLDSPDLKVVDVGGGTVGEGCVRV